MQQHHHRPALAPLPIADAVAVRVDGDGAFGKPGAQRGKRVGNTERVGRHDSLHAHGINA